MHARWGARTRAPPCQFTRHRRPDHGECTASAQHSMDVWGDVTPHRQGGRLRVCVGRGSVGTPPARRHPSRSLTAPPAPPMGRYAGPLLWRCAGLAALSSTALAQATPAGGQGAAWRDRRHIVDPFPPITPAYTSPPPASCAVPERLGQQRGGWIACGWGGLPLTARRRGCRGGGGGGGGSKRLQKGGGGRRGEARPPTSVDPSSPSPLPQSVGCQSSRRSPPAACHR